MARFFGLLLALVLLGVGALAIALPRLTASATFHDALRERIGQALGTDVDWASIDAGVLPLRIRIDHPILRMDEARRGAAGLSADAFELRVSLLALFAGRIEVDSLEMSGAELMLTRTRAGLVLPFGQGAASAAGQEGAQIAGGRALGGDPPAGVDVGRSGDGSVDVARRVEVNGSTLDFSLRRVVITDGRLIVRDQTLARAIDWHFDRLALKAEGSSLRAPLSVELEARLLAKHEDVGGLRVTGEVSLAGAHALDVEVDALQLAAFQPYVRDATLSGIASGSVRIEGEGGHVSLRESALVVDEMAVRTFGLDLSGRLDLEAKRDGNDTTAFDARLDLGRQGRVRVEGALGVDFSLSASVGLETLDLTPFAPLAGREVAIAGRASGNVELTASAEGAIEHLRADLEIADADYEDPALRIGGDLELVLNLDGLDAGSPFRFVLGLSLEQEGGRVDVEGGGALGSGLAAGLTFSGLDLGRARSAYPGLATDVEIEGLASGQVRFERGDGSPDLVSARMEIRDARFESEDYTVSGLLGATCEVRDPFVGPSGVAEFDFSEAAVRYSKIFVKPTGIRAHMAARLSPDVSGANAFEARVDLQGLDPIRLAGRVGQTGLVRLTAPRFDLADWRAFIPLAAPYVPAGLLALRDFAVEWNDAQPTRLRGRIDLDDVTFRTPFAGVVSLRGVVLGRGDHVRSKGLSASFGDVPVHLDASIEDLFGRNVFTLEMHTEGEVEANDFLSSLTTVRDTVFGILRFDGRLAGRFEKGRRLTDSLEGQIRFTVGEPGGGRLRGISLLRAVLDQIPFLGGAVRLTQPFRGGQSADDYFTDRFDRLEGDFEIGAGLVNARALRLVYPGYEARLRGPVRLRDLELDMTGELLLKDDLLSLLSGAAGAETGQREPISIPLARVTQTLDDPRVTLTPETLAAVPKLLFQASGLETMTIELGKGINRALDRVFQGK